MDRGLVTVIGMSIAYLASFIGMGLAWWAWRRRVEQPDDEAGGRDDPPLGGGGGAGGGDREASSQADSGLRDGSRVAGDPPGAEEAP